MHKQYQLTKDGIAELETEKDKLIANRKDISERIKTARELGDLAENAEYSAAKDEQDRAETRIGEIEHILLNTETISAPKKKDVVELGNEVTLTGPNGEKTFTVVGSVEADPLSGKISNESPIGKSLMGQKVGDKVEIQTPSNVASYTIKSVK